MAGKPLADAAPSALPSPEIVRAELRRILESPEFQATDRLRSFLSFVVEETLAGRSDRLKGYTVATEVFGRGEDFDPAHDPVVRIEAGRLRRALERYYLVVGGCDPLRIDVPKGRYVPRFRWQVPVAGNGMAEPAPGSEIPLPSGPSVAVLPLGDLGNDPEQRFFAEGLAEELTTELNRFQDLVVIPCHRAHTPGGSEDLEEICRSAGARFLLGGTVRRDASTSKVSMHLVDTKSGRQIWAEAYSHELEAPHLIATQERIAQSVVTAIGSEYGIIARRLSAESRKKAPAELDTYEAMLRYYTYHVDPNPTAASPCFAALQRAVEREPEYGPAWSALATLHCHMHIFDVPGFENPLETAQDYAMRGVSLEPGAQLGRLILSYVDYLAEDWDAFHSEIETTLALNPRSPFALGALGYFLVHTGAFEKGRSLLDRAIGASRFHPHWFHDALFVEAFHREEYEAALQEVWLQGKPESFWREVMAIAVLGKLGRREDAELHREALAGLKPDFPSRARELIGRPLKVSELVDDLIDGLERGGLAIAEE